MNQFSLRDEDEEARFKSGADDDNPLSKFGSLIHILKGHEEFRLDAEGIIISSNLEAVNITGYEEWEVLGKHINLFYQDTEKEQANADLERAAKFDISIISGIRLKKRSTPFWAKMKIYALRLDTGSLIGFRIILYDTTHRAISNARVRTLKDEYLAIFNNPFVGSFKFRLTDFKVQICNQKTLEILGKKDSWALSFRDFFSSQTQFDQFVSLLIKEKRVDGFKLLINDKRSNENWAVISARYFEMGNFAEGVLFDISEQHSQMVELQKLNSELDNFTYHASHDLRAPIATILGLVNLAKREPLESVGPYLAMIEDRARHLDSILRDLASVTYNNTAPTSSEKFFFEEEVQSSINKLRELRPFVKITARVEDEFDFFTDANRMRSILWNLLFNSFLVNQNGQQHDPITLSIKTNRTHVAIKMHDPHQTIEWSLKEKIWDLFFKQNGKETGSGLSLYIVKSMIEKLKGTISFESTEQEGATFLIIVPNSEEPQP